MEPKAPVSADAELGAASGAGEPGARRLAAMDEAEFERQFNGSPVRRAGFLGLSAMLPSRWATAD